MSESLQALAFVGKGWVHTRPGTEVWPEHSPRRASSHEPALDAAGHPRPESRIRLGGGRWCGQCSAGRLLTAMPKRALQVSSPLTPCVETTVGQNGPCGRR